MLRAWVFVAVTFAAIFPVGAAGSASGLDTVLATARLKLHAPAATAAVYHCGRLVWSSASGTFTDTSKVSIKPTTPFMLASSTKTITATMVLSLVQRGKLSLDDKLARFYPQVPNAASITVRELLNMTSGLDDYFSNAHILDLINNHPRHHWTRQEVIAGVKAKYPPGSRYEYINANYIILGGIIEKVSGQSIQRYFEATIGSPAHMAASTFVYQPGRSGEFPHPYTQETNGSLTDNWVPGLGLSSDYWGEVWTDGGLASTAPDLARFIDALFAGRLISASLLGRMTATGPNDYGLGIYDQGFDGHRWLGHDGDYSGYESEDWHDPSRNVSITVLTDLEESSKASNSVADEIWSAVTKAFDRMPEAARSCR